MTSDKTGPALLSQKRSTCCGSISWRTKKSETKPNFRNPLCAWLCMYLTYLTLPHSCSTSRSSSGVVVFLGPLGEHDPDQFVHRRALDDCRGGWPWSWGAGAITKWPSLMTARWRKSMKILSTKEHWMIYVWDIYIYVYIYIIHILIHIHAYLFIPYMIMYIYIYV